MQKKLSRQLSLKIRFIIIVFHSLLLMLFNYNNLLAQDNRGLIVETKSTITSSGKFHAIIISENKYSDESIVDLNEPQNDADKLYSLLVSKYFFKKEDVIRLIDPTRGDIIDAIELKRKNLTSDDNLMIFYAGHGFWDENLKMGYWLPSDSKKSSKSNWVSNADLSTYLSAIQANHILLISDACFSGGIFKTRTIGNMDQGTKRLYQLKSRKAITSGNLKEVPDNSIMMKYFLKELELNNAPFLTSDQIFAKIRPNILNNSNTEPLYGVIHNTGDEGGEFVFYAAESNISSSNVETKELVSIIKQPEKSQQKSVINTENQILDKPKRVAILNFENTSGKVNEYGDIGGPLRDMLNTDLSGVKNLFMVDRQALEKVLDEQNLNNTSRFDQSAATKLGKLLGAEIILTGTYFEFYGNLRIDARFISVETGEIAFSVGVDGAREKLFDIKNSLANKIIEKLK
jgi:TolB-like protein